MDDPNPSLSQNLQALVSTMLACHNQFPPSVEPSVARVEPRTVKPREPRQVRKEAAAAGILRVADMFGSGGAFSESEQLLPTILNYAKTDCPGKIQAMKKACIQQDNRLF